MSEDHVTYFRRLQPRDKHLLVPADVHQEVRVRAAQQGVPMREFAVQALKEHFERQDRR